MQRMALLIIVAVITAYLVARKAAPDQIGMFEESVKNSVDELLAKLEGFSATPYQDEAGLWTIGYGHKIVPGDGFWHPDFNPAGVRSITVEHAKLLKGQDASGASDAVDRCVKVPLTENQYQALVSLAYNIGSSAFCSSTVVKRLNAGDIRGAADAILWWNKVTDPTTKTLVISQGLVNRREQERALFLA